MRLRRRARWLASAVRRRATLQRRSVWRVFWLPCISRLPQSAAQITITSCQGLRQWFKHDVFLDIYALEPPCIDTLPTLRQQSLPAYFGVCCSHVMWHSRAAASSNSRVAISRYDLWPRMMGGPVVTRCAGNIARRVTAVPGSPMFREDYVQSVGAVTVNFFWRSPYTPVSIVCIP